MTLSPRIYKALGRWAFRAVLALAGLAALGVMAVSLGMIWLQSEPGKTLLRGLVEQGAEAAGFTLTLEEIAGTVPFEIKAGRIVLADAKGPFLEIRDLELSWSPPALWRRVVQVNRLAASRLALRRLPAADDAAGPVEAQEAEDGGLLPDLPVRIALGELDIRDLRIGEGVVGTPLTGRVLGDFSYGGFGSASRFTLELNGAPDTGSRLSAQGQVDPRRERARLQVRLNEPAGGALVRLLRLPDAAGWRLTLDAAGPLERLPFSLAADYGDLALLRLDGRLGLQRRVMTLAADVTARPTPFLPAALPPAVSPIEGRIEAALRRDLDVRLERLDLRNALGALSIADMRLADGAVRLERAELAAMEARIGLRGEADLRGGALDLSFDASAPDLSAYRNKSGLALSGAATLQGQAGGTLDAPTILLRGQAQGFATGIERLDAVLGDAVKLAVDGSRDGKTWRLRRLAIDAAEASMRGEGGWGEDGLSADSRLSLAIPDLTSLTGGVGGSLQAKIAATRQTAGLAPLAVTITGDDLSTESRSLGTARLTGGLERLVPAPAATLTLAGDLLDRPLGGSIELSGKPGTPIVALNGLSWGDLRLDARIDPTAGPDRQRIRAAIPDLSALSVFAGVPLSGSLTAEAVERDGTRVLELSGQGLGAGPAYSETLSATLTPDFADPSSSRATIALGEAVVAGLYTFETIEITAAPPDNGAARQLVRVRGDGAPLSLDAEAQLTLSDSGVSVRLDRLDGSVEDRPFRLAQPATVRTDNGLRVSGFELIGEDLSVAAAAKHAEDGIDSMLSATIDLSWLSPLLPAMPQGSQGRVELNARASGSLEAPEVSGTLSLSDGAYRNEEVGLDLRAISIEAAVSRDRLTIGSASAVTPGDGRASATGSLTFGAPGWPVDVSVQADNALLADTALVIARADADLQLGGKLRERADLTGSITLRQTELQIPSALPAGSTPTIPVREINTGRDDGGAGMMQPEETDDGETPRIAERIALDVSVTNSRPIRVGGRGLDARLAGALRIGQTMADPSVTGAFELEDGTFDLLGNELVFEAGTVTLDQVGRLNPRLDFRAVTQIEDSTITVSLSGRADDPKLGFSAQPPAPEDEIFSRLLFGKVTTELSAVEALQLANAVASLTGTTGGGGRTGVLRRLRSATGLDLLEIESAGPTGDDVAVRAGRFVTDRVFVGVRQGATAESTAVEVEAEVTDNLKLRSELGADANTSIGLRYEWDY